MLRATPQLSGKNLRFSAKMKEHEQLWVVPRCTGGVSAFWGLAVWVR